MQSSARWEMADNKNEIIFIVSHFLSLSNIKIDLFQLALVIKNPRWDEKSFITFLCVSRSVDIEKFELTDFRHTWRHASNQQVIDLRYLELFVLIIIKMSELLCLSTLYCVYFFSSSLRCVASHWHDDVRRTHERETRWISKMMTQRLKLAEKNKKKLENQFSGSFLFQSFVHNV